MLRETGEHERVRIEQAVLKTILYADLFDYPLTPAEASHYLPEVPCTLPQILEILARPVWLNGRIAQRGGYLVVRGREEIVRLREARNRASRRLWKKARLYAAVLSRLPFVRMIAVTGALAMDNSGPHDDVDVLIMAAPGRVWLCRAFAVVLVRLGKATRSTLCPNYILAQDMLEIEPRTIYVAHEFAQMVPMYGFEVYRRLRSANSWIQDFLPNAGQPLRPLPECRVGLVSNALKRAAERFLSGRLGDRLEAWEMRRKIRKFARRGATDGNVVFDRRQVKGHFDDHGSRIEAKYQALLERYRLSLKRE